MGVLLVRCGAIEDDLGYYFVGMACPQSHAHAAVTVWLYGGCREIKPERETI